MNLFDHGSTTCDSFTYNFAFLYMVLVIIIILIGILVVTILGIYVALHALYQSAKQDEIAILKLP